MKITDIRLEHGEIALDPPLLAAWDPHPRRSFAWTVVRVETDAGVVGVGSGDEMRGFERYAEEFVGTDPLAIEPQVRRLETLGGGYWPLEVALWDVIGQVAGLPVATLFGGVTDRLPVYASWCSEQPPARRVDDAHALVDAGFRAVKVRAHPARLDDAVAVVAAVRESTDLAVMVDLNQAWRMPGDTTPPLELADVRRVARTLADLGVTWLEEPRPYGDVAGMAALRADNPGLRIAAGEVLDSLPDTLALLEVLDVVQTDVVLALGPTRTRQVAEAARTRHRRFTPHTWTNGLGLLANLHVAAGMGAGPYLEFPYDPAGGWTPERRDALLAEPLLPDADGMLVVPDAPGLGAVLTGVNRS